MTSDITALVPSAYVKKSKKTTVSNDIEEVIAVLDRKFNAWNINYTINSKAGTAYKLKYDQFENALLAKSHLILYVVDLPSEESFRRCITKLASTCHDRKKLSRIIVICLDNNHFEDLNEPEINLIFFGNSWRTESDIQWEVLEEVIREKLQSIKTNHDSQHYLKSLTAPLPIPHQKSSFKIKSFFNSLPSKFDIDKRHFKIKPSPEELKDSVPNIKISDSNEECLSIEGGKKDIGLRQKQNSSKLSLNSLFRKRSSKARDSGLSIGSSISNGSDSKSNMPITVDMNINEGDFNTVSCGNSPSCERALELHTPTLNKTRQYKAKILIYKEKASKALQSANCLQSPANKRRKHEEQSIADEGQFSGHQIIQFSDVLLKNLGSELKSCNNIFAAEDRDHCETATKTEGYTEVSPLVNGKIKYYSWNSDLNKGEEHIFSNSSCNISEVITSVSKGQENNAPTETNIEDNDMLDPINSIDISLNLFEDNDTSTGQCRNFEEVYEEDIDDKYFKVQYAANCQLSPMKTEKHSVTFKIEGMDSLENIVESIQKSCNEMKIKSKENEDHIVLNTFKSKPDMKSNSKVVTTDIIHESKHSKLETLKKKDEDRENLGKADIQKIADQSISNIMDTKVPNFRNHLPAPKTPLRSESNRSSGSSFLYRTTTCMIANPFVVLGIFTATALTAPLWSVYIPHYMEIGHFLYQTTDEILKSEMLRSVPQKVISTTSIGATATANSLRRLFVGTVNNYIFYRV